VHTGLAVEGYLGQGGVKEEWMGEVEIPTLHSLYLSASRPDKR
jgi:hypothetical protein